MTLRDTVKKPSSIPAAREVLIDALTADPESFTLAEFAEHCNPRLLLRGDRLVKL